MTVICVPSSMRWWTNWMSEPDTASGITPMFPLQTALLPGEELPLRVFEPRYAALVRDCLAGGDRRFGVVLIARGREVGGGDERHDVGVMVRIAAHDDLGNGRYRLNCPGLHRIRVVRWLPDQPYPRAVTRDWPDEPELPDVGEITRVEDDIWGLFEFVAAARGSRLPGRAAVLGDLPADAGARLYALAARLPIGPADRYALLAAPGPVQRLAALREAVETVSAMTRFQLSGDDR